jgi:hypothetical protein
MSDASEEAENRISKCIFRFYQQNQDQNHNTKTAAYGTAQIAANDSKKHKL